MCRGYVPSLALGKLHKVWGLPRVSQGGLYRSIHSRSALCPGSARTGAGAPGLACQGLPSWCRTFAESLHLSALVLAALALWSAGHGHICLLPGALGSLLLGLPRSLHLLRPLHLRSFLRLVTRGTVVPGLQLFPPYNGVVRRAASYIPDPILRSRRDRARSGDRRGWGFAIASFPGNLRPAAAPSGHPTCGPQF